MKKIIGILCLLLTGGFIINPQDADAATNRYRLTLRADPATTAVIGWNQVSGSTAVVYYGTTDNGTNWSAYPNSKTVDRSVTFAGMNNNYARLTGLQPNTAYYFVIKDSDGTSQRFWFKTLPNDPAQRLSIIAGGDSRNNRTPRQNANRLVAKLRPHVVMFGGDMTASGTDIEWMEWFDDWQLTIAADGRMFPVMATRGNHESSNTFIDNLFDVPNPGVYYALTLGGSLVRAYTLNTESSISGTQTTWLANDLAANSNVTWKIAQYHRPMRPHNSGKTDGTTQYSNWAPLFQQHNVKLVVESDAHTVKTTWPVVPSSGAGSDEGFVRDDANGTVYVGEGCWGAPLRVDDDTKSWTRNSGMFNHFNWFFIDQEKIEIRTVQVDNAQQVASLTDATIFNTPANLAIWNPSNGPVITLTNPNYNSGSGTGTGTGGSHPRILIKGAFAFGALGSGSNDVEQSQAGSMYSTSTDIELVNDGTNGNQTVGLRFTGLQIPQGATINTAYIQFTCDETSTAATNLVIKGENADNSAVFTSASNDASSRAMTTASVSWAPSAWNVVNEAGAAQRTPNLAAVIQQLVNRSGWVSGNAMTFIVTGTGKRTAHSYESSPAFAPRLVVNYAPNSNVRTGQERIEETLGAAMLNDVKASPNPFSDVLYLDMDMSGSSREEKLEITVYDLSGRLCIKRTETWMGDKLSLTTDMLSAGTYLVVTEHNEQRVVKKLVKY
jgi:hypothetical protein